MNRCRIRRKLSWNEKGALEGLPLYLIILVIITAVAIVIILAWLQPWKTAVDLKVIEVTPSSIQAGKKTTVTVKAFDTKNNPLPGVTITVDGCGVSISGGSATTGSDGTVKIDLTPNLPQSTSSGSVTVTGTYTGGTTGTIAKTATITVTH